VRQNDTPCTSCTPLKGGYRNVHGHVQGQNNNIKNIGYEGRHTQRRWAGHTLLPLPLRSGQWVCTPVNSLQARKSHSRRSHSMKSIHPGNPPYPSTVSSLLFIDMSLDPRKDRKGPIGYRGSEQSAFRRMAEEALGGFGTRHGRLPS